MRDSARAALAAAGGALLLACAAGAWAQSPEPSPQPEAAQQKGPDTGGGTFFDPEKEVKHYDHNLTLSEEQKAKVLKIEQKLLDAYKKNMDQRELIRRKTMALHQLILQYNRKLKEADGEMEAARLKSRADIRGLLAPGQAKTFDAMEARADQQRQESQARDAEAAQQEHPEGEGGPENGRGRP